MATYLCKLKHGDMRNKCPNIRVPQGPIYTRAKMGVYAGLANYVVNQNEKTKLRNGTDCLEKFSICCSC